MSVGLFQPVGESSGDLHSYLFGTKNFQKLRKVSEGIGPKVKGCNGYLKIKSLFRLMMGLFNILQYIGAL